MGAELILLRRAMLPVTEILESRVLKSIALLDGQIQVRGTRGDDVVRVDSDDSPSRIKVTLNAAIRRYNTADVSSIVITAIGGDDDVAIASNVLVRTSVYGDSGADTILGGGGRDAIFGGDGNDVIAGNGGSGPLRGGTGGD